MKLDVKIAIAFFGVICIWSTTPLALQWSNIDNGHLFSVMARMCIGGFFSLILLFALGGRFVIHRMAIFAYTSAGLGIFFGMALVYKAANQVPSGWIAVMFSLNPLLTAFIAHVFIAQERLKLWHIVGLVIGMFGVGLIFQDGLQLSIDATWALVLIALSVFSFSLSGVLIRRFANGVSPMATNVGAHIVAVPLFILNWFLFDGNLDLQFSLRGGLSLLYLGVFGSVFGFFLYFYLIQRVGVTSATIVMMITPVTGLLTGMMLNGEAFTNRLWIGTALLIAGLGINLWSSSSSINKQADL